MQSYKIRKNSETSLFYIENELKEYCNSVDKSWTYLLTQFVSILFSGMGVTLLCQEKYIPTFIKSIFHVSDIELLIIEVIVAFALLAAISILLFRVITFVQKHRDKKKNEEQQKMTAEVFHKVILNNVVMGSSLIKKVEGIIENINISSQGDISEMAHECCLYISQAIFYFAAVRREMNNWGIIEVYAREENKKFIQKVGLLALVETVRMYLNSLENVKEILKEIKESLEGDSENPRVFLIHLSIGDIDDLLKDAIDWKKNLDDTIKKMMNEI